MWLSRWLVLFNVFPISNRSEDLVKKKQEGSSELKFQHRALNGTLCR